MKARSATPSFGPCADCGAELNDSPSMCEWPIDAATALTCMRSLCRECVHFVETARIALCTEHHTAYRASKETGRLDGLWWLSFADGSFLGACIVRAKGPASAAVRARELGIHPGGQVVAVGPMAPEMPILDGWTDRLLTRTETDELEHIMDGN